MQIPLNILTEMLGYLQCLDNDSYCILLLAADGVPLKGEGLGSGCAPSPENVGTFSLEIAHFGANSVVF